MLGFSFGEKLWGEFCLIYSNTDISLTSNTAEFAVANIKEIEWSLLPFNCLSIPEEQRDVIMALVEARLDPSVEFDDCIVGKRREINMLLQYSSYILIYLKLLTWQSGPPSVGKTLIAEAVSKHLKKPLYLVCFPSCTLG